MPQTATLRSKSSLSEATVFLLHEAPTASDNRDFLKKTLPQIWQSLGSDYAAVIESNKGSWRPIVFAGSATPLPEDLASDALDRGQIVHHTGWHIGPLQSRDSNN